MSGIVADTHTIIWYLVDDPRLSNRAGAALDQATGDGNPIYIPTMCIVEATYLVEKRRIDPSTLSRLKSALLQPDSPFRAAPLNTDVAFRLREIPRDSVPDLPDRVIAATALALGLPLVTRDGKIRTSCIETIW